METAPISAQEVLRELQALGNPGYKRMLMANHGIREPFFGVKIGDMKPLAKRLKGQHQLALELYDSGVYDAMYLAGLIADEARMSKKDLQRWADKAYGGALPGATVAAVAAGGPHGWSMGLKWIESKKPLVAVAGWTTLAGCVAVQEDAALDQAALLKLLERVEKEIGSAPDAVRYAMNSFLISLGIYVRAFTGRVKTVAKRIGKVSADLGNNSCAVPSALEYIAKVEKRGTLGRKRKTLKC